MKRIIVFCCFICSICCLASAQEVLPYPMDTIDGKVYYRYTVERSIGLYRISQNFGVSQEEILKANPQVQHGLRYDDVILIPTSIVIKPAKASHKVVTKPLEQERNGERERISRPMLKRQKDTVIAITPDTTAIADTLLADTLATQMDTLRLAIMLPLHADALKRNKTMERFYDFYAGALMAIYDIQREKQALELFVYDIGKTDIKIKQLLTDSLFPQVDAIVGPAYGQQVEAAAHYAQKDSTWMLIPFISEVAAINSNPYLLQFNPSTQIAADTLAAYLAQHADSINCVLIAPSADEKIPQSILTLHNALQAYDIPRTSTTITAILADSIDSALVPDKENIIIFNTEKYNNLKMLMPHLLRARETHNNITLYSQYSWQSEKIVLPQIYTSAFKCDYSVPEEYTELWEQYFTHELTSSLPRYDVLGYDLTYHLLRMLQAQAAEDTLLPAEQLQHMGIQSDTHYHKLPEGGYINRNIHIVRK